MYNTMNLYPRTSNLESRSPVEFARSGPASQQLRRRAREARATLVGRPSDSARENVNYRGRK